MDIIFMRTGYYSPEGRLYLANNLTEFGERKTSHQVSKQCQSTWPGVSPLTRCLTVFFSLSWPRGATLRGKHISGWRPWPVFRSSQTPSICLPGQIGTLAVYSLHHILHPATSPPPHPPSLHSSPGHQPAHAYKNSPACPGQSTPQPSIRG